MDFESADKKVHLAEDQWHYDTMIKYGFKCETPAAIGFVRSYLYTRGSVQIRCSTGVHSDHWSCRYAGNTFYGLHSLETFLNSLPDEA